MCYGNLDPKYGMRDLEARVKASSRVPDAGKETAPHAWGGLIALARAVWAVMRGKDVPMSERSCIEHSAPVQDRV